MTHIGLFEGIGGFSLAARWAGWHTPVMVEWNPYCQNATIFGDIHEFDGRPYAGQFDFPCWKSRERSGEVKKGTAEARRRAYKARHAGDRKTKGTPGWYADKLLW